MTTSLPPFTDARLVAAMTAILPYKAQRALRRDLATTRKDVDVNSALVRLKIRRQVRWVDCHVLCTCSPIGMKRGGRCFGVFGEGFAGL